MSTYADGFAAGERDAWADRNAGLPLKTKPVGNDPYRRGYHDGYMPRSATWWPPRNHAETWAQNARAQAERWAQEFTRAGAV